MSLWIYSQKDDMVYIILLEIYIYIHIFVIG